MFVCLLRGVNVGGHRRVPMAELRVALGELGFESVATYIQSGNVVFGAGPEDPGEVVRRCLADRFGVDAPVVLRTAEQLAAGLAASERIFPPDAGEDAGALAHDKRVHILFLSDTPSVDRLGADVAKGEEAVLDGRELHVRYQAGAGKSRLTIDGIERALGVTATGRNLATVRALVRLAFRPRSG
jgi:uncharacterized protein (DUF1697 family)